MKLLNKTGIWLSAVLILTLAISVFCMQRSNFTARKSSGKIAIYNTNTDHYPAISVQCIVNKKTYRSTYAFLPAKGSLQIKPADFSDADGDTLKTVDAIDKIEISGGDALIDEAIEESVTVY